MKKITSVILALLMTAGTLTACGTVAADREDVQEDPEETTIEETAQSLVISDITDLSEVMDHRVSELPEQIAEGAGAGYTDFTFDLLSECLRDGGDDNIMISPQSLMFALMAANTGARENTRDQMTDVMFRGSTFEEAMDFTSAIMETLNAEYENCTLNSYNSVWMDEDYADLINEDFLQALRDDLDAQINTVPFVPGTEDIINDMVREQTDGMIDGIIDEIGTDEMMYLINTLNFQGAWVEEFPEEGTSTGIFVNSLGEEEEASLMTGPGRIFLQTDLATGFIKSYYGPYCFIAILPKDDSISANEFASSFTSDDYDELIQSRQGGADFFVTVPQFSFDTSLRLDEQLQALGMTDAFSGADADFTGIADIQDNNIFISRVLQNTHIDLDEHGTSAAAASSVCLATLGISTEVQNVDLTRPFMFVIADSETMAPVFVGTVNSVAQN